MERGGRFKATCPGDASRFVVDRALLLCGLKQTGRSEIVGWSSFIGAARPHLESWEVRLANYTVDRAEKGENPMAGAESKAVVGDSQ